MKKFFALLLVLIGSTTATMTAQDYVPTEENLQSRKEFEDMRFGVFIHWGIYSMLADGEWVQNTQNIDRGEYAHLAAGFYPSKFDARQWVKAIKDAGAGYITITSRHHDGFSMFGTRWSDYNIVDATPFKRDVLKELADECERLGVRLHFYYSHMDWYRTDYPTGVNYTKKANPKETVNWASYYQFMNNQLTELLTNYGKIGAIWFDGMWDHKTDLDWQLGEQYALIHRLQPACLIGNNHHAAINAGEDFQLFEQDLPGGNSHGWADDQAVSQEMPLESCVTMNNSWGYNITDKSYKSADDLIRFIVKSAGMNANTLLNIGPRPDGQFPDEALERLAVIGKWMSKYGVTIKGTRGGIIAPQSWGVSTMKGKKLYLHILNFNDTKLNIPLSGKMIKSASPYGESKKLETEKGKYTTTIVLTKIPDEVDTIIEVELK